jgi:nucleotide-binding universal stress UspA family protein
MKRFLVGLDGSEHQARVLNEAVAWAKKAGAKLLLFRSVGLPPSLPPDALGRSPTEIEQMLVGRARADLEGLRDLVPPDCFGGISVREGTPWRGVLEAAHAENVDLIIIGSHGYGGLDRVLGTTAAKIVNHADRSVLVVRNGR